MNGQTVYLDVDYAMEDGGGPITHLWLMDESGDNPDQTFVPEERAIAAETERDRLREYRERHDSLQRAKLAEIRDENAKLRELVRHLYECMCNIDMDGNHECFSCEYENTDGLCDYERLMCELGVEVDNG